MQRVVHTVLLLFLIYNLGSSNGNPNQNNGFCVIPKIQNQNALKLVADKEECDKINQEFKVDENYNFINYFGNIFDHLMNGIGTFNIPNPNSKMNVIFFVGNTGSGKSTTIQVLAGDNKQIFSKPVREGSGENILVDYGKIGTDTITSETLYPNVVVDKETGYVFCDNPGFRDTRSPIHEIVSMYSMRKVLKFTDKIKIVLVTTRASLKVGMYREDFLNTLKHLAEFIHDLPKYENSLFLLGTKVENTGAFLNGSYQLITDDMVINDIAFYLKEVKNSLNEKTNHSVVRDYKIDFYQKAIKIIEKFQEKDGDVFTRINIIRRPDDVGPVSNIQSLQKERTSIRNQLVTDKNFISVNYNDFGIPLTDSSLLFLNDLYMKMNSYITDLSKLISVYLSNRYESYIKSNFDILNTIEELIKIKSSTKSFSNELGQSKNPGEFINAVKQFSDNNQLKFDCLASFQNISTLNEFLSSLEDLSNSNKYNPLSWNMTMKIVNDYVEEKLEEYSFLKDIFDLLSRYKSQQHRNLYNVRDIQHWGLNNKEQGLEINKNNLNNFIKVVNLNNRYSTITVNQELINRVNSIINLALKHQHKYICKDKTLTIIDYYIVLSELNGKYPSLCGNAKKVEIFALHTLFIDKDLSGGWFNGKHVTIIAPIWDVIGTRTISVEGQSGGGQMPKENFGQIGKNGESGRPGGKFLGIGQIFRNSENLVINVRGGNGQNGQDGGDGRNGKDGAHGNEGRRDGEPGEAGGDAGEGGKGGFGGIKGSLLLYNIGKENHKISFETGNGIQGSDGRTGNPGIGGVKGCDLRFETDKDRFLGFTYRETVTSYFTNCNIRSRNGYVRKRTSLPVPFSVQNVPSKPICTLIEDFKKHYVENYKSVLSDGITEIFINRMISTKY